MTQIKKTFTFYEHQESAFIAGSINNRVVKELREVYSVGTDARPEDDGTFSWVLSPGSVVGVVQLSDGSVVRFKPKTPIGNLFAMWQIAHDSEMKLDWTTSTGVDSIEDLYDKLAATFVTRIHRRITLGLHRTYERREGPLPALRGRVDIRRNVVRPWDTRIHCAFEEHEQDNRLNQLLLWALYVILRSAALQSEHTRRRVVAVFRLLAGSVSLVHYRPPDYTSVVYTRLTNVYEPLHAMARFFVDHASPALPGSALAKAVPFWIYMPKLFESFVASWLRAHLPSEYELREQSHLTLKNTDTRQHASYELIPDIVIYRTQPDRRAVAILDTKYKVAGAATQDDIEQVYVYAAEFDAPEAWLVYPVPLEKHVDLTTRQSVRIRSVHFDLTGDLDAAGFSMMRRIGIDEEPDPGTR